MQVIVNNDKMGMARYAAETGARKIREAIQANGHATITLAAGLSQVDMLACLASQDIPWEKVEVFPLDEFLGIPQTHPSSFSAYLTEHFLSKVKNLGAYHDIKGDSKDSDAEIERMNALMGKQVLDVAFICIGENGHVAFNDPPADLLTDKPYIKVTLDDRCRRQQIYEGWFPSFAEVPPTAITMSVKQIMRSKAIIATVPDIRKARAVASCLFDQPSPYSPCSILRWAPYCDLCLDRQSSSLVFRDCRSTT